MARSNIVSYVGLIARSLYPRNISTNSQYFHRLPTSLTSLICHSKIVKNAYPSSLVLSTTVTTQVQRAFSAQSGNQPGASPPPGTPPPPPWRNWTAGIVMAVVVPLLNFKEDVDTLVETTEQFLGVVEVMADAIDMVAENVNKELQDGSKLKPAIEFVEDVAEKVAENAQKAGDFIDEVQEMEHKLEKVIEPVKLQTKEAA